MENHHVPRRIHPLVHGYPPSSMAMFQQARLHCQRVKCLLNSPGTTQSFIIRVAQQVRDSFPQSAVKLKFAWFGVSGFLIFCSRKGWGQGDCLVFHLCWCFVVLLCFIVVLSCCFLVLLFCWLVALLSCCLNVCLSACLPACLSVSLSAYPSIDLSVAVYMHLWDFIWYSIT